jgi:hypothetical protein
MRVIIILEGYYYMRVRVRVPVRQCLKYKIGGGGSL